MRIFFLKLTTWIVSVVILGLGLPQVGLDAQQTAVPRTVASQLPTGIQQKLEKVVLPALTSGNEEQFMQAMLDVIQRCQVHNLDAMDDFGIQGVRLAL